MKSLLKKLLKKLDDYEMLEQDAKQIEPLHKIRVTARKLVALSEPDSYSAQVLKRLIQASNALRDLDVLRSETLPKLPAKWQPKLTELYQQLAQQREELDAQFKLRLQMELYDEIHSLVDEFEPLQQPKSDSQPRHQLPLKEIEKRLKAQVKWLRTLDIKDQQVHKVRLKIKRLRYQLEHFYPQQIPALEMMTYLQNTLGEFQDLCQGKKWLEKHASLASPTLNAIQGLLEARKQTILHKVRGVLNKKYRKLEWH